MSALADLTPPLPIDAVLPQLLAVLRAHQAAVLVAPTGAGKTTRVPPALLTANIAGQGSILVLQPRRLAARALARQMARILGEEVGQTVGYQVRFDSKRSAQTRILVLTEGILSRRLIADPLLQGVGCVILDEFHERSLHADLALAFLRQVLEARPELRLLVMSATLESDPLRRFLGCPEVVAQSRTFPLEIQHLSVAGRLPLAQQVATAVRRLLADPADDGGDILVFLPGAPEIQRSLDTLRQHPPAGGLAFVPLHGALPPADQDRALAAGSQRRVVLATNIAETSLTVPGVTAVIDSGLAKEPHFDARVGLDRLELAPISQSSAEQRAGRAGRTAPGRVLRLWSEADQLGRRSARRPEIQRLDLAPALLAVLAFQPGDPRRFPFFEPPPKAALASALELLGQLGALAPDGQRLSPRGQRLAELPLHPRLGVMLLEGAAAGLLEQTALLAALLSEREVLARHHGPVPTVDSDLLYRRDLVLELARGGATTQRAHQLGLSLGAARRALLGQEQLLRLCRQLPQKPAQFAAGSEEREALLRQLILTGYPDRVCRRRQSDSACGVMVGGRGVRLDEASGVRDSPLFLALEADAGQRGLHAMAQVHLASGLSAGDLAAAHPALLREERELRFSAARQQVMTLERRCFIDLPLEERELPAAADAQASRILAEQASAHFAALWRPAARTEQLIARLRLASRMLPDLPWPDASETGLRGLIEAACAGRTSFAELTALDWDQELRARLEPRARITLERELPSAWRVPSGREVAIDYRPVLSGGEPLLSVKLQELFGLADTPRIARGKLPLLIHLLAPSGRPVQVTRDLRSFWSSTYHEVRKDLRGRYPKHPWPEDPWTAPPTARTKRRAP